MSSNINEVIRAVISFLVFYEKILHTQKAQKAPKGTKTLGQEPKNIYKQISDYFLFRCFLSA